MQLADAVYPSWEMIVRALAPWMGGKRTMAPQIVTELGKHTQYFEPFCGSMAVLFAKEPSQKETVCDMHGDIVNLARVIQDEKLGVWLFEALQRVLFCESILQDARDFLAERGEINQEDPPDAKRAYWYFIACWMGRNGTAGTARAKYQIATRWTKGGGSPTVRWRNALRSMPAWHQRLQNVVILCRDSFEILDRFEDVIQTAIYLDPPYIIDGETRSGVKCSGDSSHQYKHEFSNRTRADESMPLLCGLGDEIEEEPDHHEQLRNILMQYENARIVLSYYDCDRVRELYEGWTFVEHHRVKHLHNPGSRGVGKEQEAPEVLILNGASYALAN